MKLYVPSVVVVASLMCLITWPALAQPPMIGFSWSEEVNLAEDSGGAPLDSNSSAKVVWDKDMSGIADWNPADPLPDGDEVVLDFADVEMSAPFGPRMANRSTCSRTCRRRIARRAWTSMASAP
jgi:hypothetical protein